MNKNYMMTALSASAMLFGLCALPAAHAQTLHVGTNSVNDSITFNGTSENAGGGNVTQTTLTTTSTLVLPNVYCVDLTHTINLGGTYASTTVTTDGKIYGTAINNGGEVAWLMDKYAQSAYGNSDAEGALQAAIWKAVFGTNFSLNSTGNDSILISDYNADITALGANASTGNGGLSASVSDINWIGAGGGTYQGLVYNVPEPGVVALAAGVLVTGSVFTIRRRTKKKQS